MYKIEIDGHQVACETVAELRLLLRLGLREPSAPKLHEVDLDPVYQPTEQKPVATASNGNGVKLSEGGKTLLALLARGPKSDVELQKVMDLGSYRDLAGINSGLSRSYKHAGKDSPVQRQVHIGKRGKREVLYSLRPGAALS